MSHCRIVTLCPGIIDEIEQCWMPHHFRAAIKRSRNAFKAIEYFPLILARIDFVIEYKANLEALEMIQELREEVEGFINANEPKPIEGKHFQMHEKQLRILNAKKVLDKEKAFKKSLLSENVDFIEKNLTLQVWEETKRDKAETSRRLGISRGTLVQRLINYGAYP